MKIVSICLIILCMLIVALDASARKKHKAVKIEVITFTDHQKAINGIICGKYVDCGMVVNKGSCQERLDGVTESNTYNMSTMAYKHRSEKCLEFLTKETSCSDVSQRSIDGPCNLNELTKR